jgi:hypothetical protein
MSGVIGKLAVPAHAPYARITRHSESGTLAQVSIWKRGIYQITPGTRPSRRRRFTLRGGSLQPIARQIRRREIIAGC